MLAYVYRKKIHPIYVDLENTIICVPQNKTIDIIANVIHNIIEYRYFKSLSPQQWIHRQM